MASLDYVPTICFGVAQFSRVIKIFPQLPLSCFTYLVDVNFNIVLYLLLKIKLNFRYQYNWKHDDKMQC